MAFEVLTSTDVDGDGCLVIRRTDRSEWLTKYQLDQISDALAEWLEERFPELGQEDTEECEYCGYSKADCDCWTCGDCGAVAGSDESCPNGCVQDEDDNEDSEEEDSPEPVPVAVADSPDDPPRRLSAADRFFL
jgi:hypothetical protein